MASAESLQWKYRAQDDYYTCHTSSWHWVIYTKTAFFQLQRAPILNRNDPAVIIGTFKKLSCAQNVVKLIEKG